MGKGRFVNCVCVCGFGEVEDRFIRQLKNARLFLRRRFSNTALCVHYNIMSVISFLICAKMLFGFSSMALMMMLSISSLSKETDFLLVEDGEDPAGEATGSVWRGELPGCWSLEASGTPSPSEDGRPPFSDGAVSPGPGVAAETVGVGVVPAAAVDGTFAGLVEAGAAAVVVPPVAADAVVVAVLAVAIVEGAVVFFGAVAVELAVVAAVDDGGLGLAGAPFVSPCCFPVFGVFPPPPPSPDSWSCW